LLLQNDTALVTGAAGGIGRGIALHNWIDPTP
jgi:NAD(P)-dependent dehydrogenase (short-subunit alcohol dehydrogenase family)